MSKINNLKFNIISNVENAKNIWQKLSHNDNIYDNWDFRYCFYKYFNYPLRFYAGYSGGELIGLLPLQYNSELKTLEFFGGSFMEDNYVFIKPGYEEYIPKFYNNIKEPARLEDIAGEDPFTKSLDIFEYKYVSDLEGLKSINEYLIKYFKAKGRNAVRKKIKSIEKLKPVIIENNFKDLDLLIELNKKEFGKESSFNKPFRRETYHDLLKMNLDIKMMTFIINGVKEAVTIGIKYKNIFVGMNGGTRKEAHQDLRTYITVKKMEKAIECGANKYDAGIDDFGWKKNWHLEKIPQRIFIYE